MPTAIILLVAFIPTNYYSGFGAPVDEEAEALNKQWQLLCLPNKADIEAIDIQ